MIFGSGALGERALDGMAIQSALATLGLDRTMLVVGKGARPVSLSGLKVDAVRCDFDGIGAAVAVAAAARAQRLVLELPGELDVEGACRTLFAVLSAHPGLSLAIQTPRTGPLADPGQLLLVLEDLAGRPLGYWHRPARGHLSGLEETDWLDLLGGSLVGLSLDDISGTEEGLPPGLGELDYRTLADIHGRRVTTALDVDPVADVALLKIALDTLRANGFR